MTEDLPLADLIDSDTVRADGVLTVDEIDAELRAKALDPGEFDHLYDDGAES